MYALGSVCTLAVSHPDAIRLKFFCYVDHQTQIMCY